MSEGAGAAQPLFTVTKTCPGTRARCGVLRLRRGAVETPVFMPVGTLGTVKAMTPDEVRGLGANLILANAYHLHLRPGSHLIERLGGLHAFMGWDGSILTDSGGYQIFSLRSMRTISEHGVTFRDPIQGDLIELTPEEVIRIQERLGSDILMPLDQPVSWEADREETERATDRSDRWAERACAERERIGLSAPDRLLFGIQQGGFHEELRTRSSERLISLGFDGYAVGGLSFDEPDEVTNRLVPFCASLLPEDKPRYLMGVGMPGDLVRGVAAGIDMFDCVLPTRLARHSVAFVGKGKAQLRNARWREHAGPLDPDCTCEACRRYPAAYLAHLVHSKEILGIRLLTLHNLHHLLRLMERIRTAISDGSFPALLTDYEVSSCLELESEAEDH